MVRLLGLLLVGCLSGQGYVGINGFASLNSKFPCEKYINLVNIADKPAMSVLEGTFSNGLGYSCVGAFIDSNKDRDHLVQVHLFNESCRDDGKCGKSDFYSQYDVKKFNKTLEKMPSFMKASIKNLVSRVDKELVSRGNKNTKVIFSTGLEDNYTIKAWLKLKKEISKHTKFEIMRSPLNDKVNIVGLLESHGVSGALCAKRNRIASNDGKEITGNEELIKQFAKNKNCYAIFYWDSAIQGRDKGFKPALEREFKYSIALEDSFQLFLNYLQGDL